MAQRYFIPQGNSSEKDSESKKATDDPKEIDKDVDQYEGPAPIPENRKKVHKRGHRVNTLGIKDAKLKGYLRSLEKKEDKAVSQAARYELLLTEEPGHIETESGEKSWKIKQYEIAEAADVASASKLFELKLEQFGPYRIDYTRNGRHLLIGGRRGHVAAFDWMTKRLTCEMNVMESTTDVKWLHTENMFAVAQRRWMYIYDNQGIELHCLKQFNETLRLDFLPYHFLLVATNARGYLQYLDVSKGEIISTINTKSGRLDVMCQNPSNAVMLLGHYNGTVTMWSPNQKEALAKVLCHKSALRAVAVDNQGNYLATAGQDRRMRIFDLRTYKPLQTYKMSAGPSNLQFSQRGLLAATCNNVVEVYKDACVQHQDKPYLTHSLQYPAHDLKFCPYEDVLGVGCADGFASLLVPGAGEPNYDGFETNPYRKKKERREWEVKALLEKIQPDIISLDPFQLAKVDHVTAERLQKDKEERLGYKPEPPKFKPRLKKKGKSKAGNIEKRKTIVRGVSLREKIIKEKEEKRRKLEDEADNPPPKAVSNSQPSAPPAKRAALSRFSEPAT